MRYNLGYMDKYPIEAAGSTVENNPMLRVFFRRPIDPVRLESAVLSAFKTYPLFGTSVEFDHEYYLRTNERPLVILHCTEEDRPRTFGKSNNGYPWRFCYDGNKLVFEWLHGVSDGMGAMSFLRQVLMIYFEHPVEEKSVNFTVAPGLEPFFDAKEKGQDFKIEPNGFSIKDFPRIKRGYKTDCHLLRGDTKEIVALAKVCGSSVAPVIAVLFSQALRMHLPEKAKNRNVACNIVLDLRRSLHYETMHNCVEYKRITYVDEYDKMNFRSVAQEYKRILDHARLTPNVVRTVTERVKTFKMYHILGKKWFLKFCIRMIGLFMKHTDCNFVLTYLGAIDLPRDVKDQLLDIDLKAWHDFGECIMCALDYDGKFNLNVSENFAEKGVVEDFIRLSAEVGIHWEETECSVFEQCAFEE